MSMLAIIGAQRPYLARNYLNGEAPRAHTDMPNTSSHILGLAEFSVVCQIGRCISSDRDVQRVFMNGRIDSNNETLCQVHQSLGLIQALYANDSGSVNLVTSTIFDDFDYHVFGFTRDLSPSLFSVWGDGGSSQDSVTVEMGVSGSTGDDGVGNVNPATPASEDALRGTLTKYFVLDKSITGNEQVTLIDTGVLPGGVSILFELLGGVDTSTVIAEPGR